MEVTNLFKILIIGASGVGKTCLLNRYVDNEFTESFISTIGVDFKMHRVQCDNRVIQLQIWDTAGQDRFRTITRAYYRGAHGVIFVYDSSNRETYKTLHMWFQEADQLAGPTIPKILVEAKSDLVSRREVSLKEAQQFADEHGMLWFSTSAKCANGVAPPFEKLVQLMLEQLPKRLNVDSKQENVILLPYNQKPRKRCCT